jgi:hypothetical protein
MARVRRSIAAGVVAVLLLAACSGGDEDTAADDAGVAGAGEGGVATEELEAQPPDGDGLAGAPEASAGRADEPASSVPAPADVPVEPGRQVILTGAIDVEVESVASAVAKAITVAQGVGGVVVGEQTDYAEDVATSVLTMKVPPDQLRAALSALGELGTVQSQRVGSEDVTEQIVDVESRIRTAEISVERLRTYLAQATSTADVAALEAELLRRETDLETLRGQQRSLEERVALATIVITLRTGAAQNSAGAIDEPGPGFADALDAGLDALVGFGTVVALIAGAVLPWLPLVAAAVLAVWLLAHRPRRRARPASVDGERTPERVG